MNQKLNILVIFDTAGTPPKNQDYTKEFKTEDWEAEANIVKVLNELGHTVRLLGVFDTISPILDEVKKDRPDIIFNLVEQFNNEPVFDRNVVGLFELLEIPYTGTGLAGLMLCKNKGIAKKILTHHNIKTPAFSVYHRGQKISPPKELAYPILVKPLREEASYGISQNSLVQNDQGLIERIRFVHESMDRDAIAEEYVEGRELYVSLLGNQRLQVFPSREMIFGEVPDEEPKIATFKAKWDKKYRKRWGIKNTFSKEMPQAMEDKIAQVCKQVYHLLYMKGYGRLDIRLTPADDIVVIEANPNPFIAKDEDFALSAKKGGIEYNQLIQKILNLGLEL